MDISFKKSLGFGFKKLGLPYWDQVNFMTWDIGLDLENAQVTLQDKDWFYDLLELDFKSGQTALLGLDWFCNVLKGGWTALMDLDWFYDMLDLDLNLD